MNGVTALHSTMTLDQLPRDLLLEVQKHLDFGDLCALMLTNKRLYTNIQSLSSYVITAEMKKFSSRRWIKDSMERDITNKLQAVHYKQPHHLQLINSLCAKDDPFSRYILYIIVETYLHGSLLNVRYHVSFLDSMVKFHPEFRLLCTSYFDYLLESSVIISFDTLAVMSKYLVNTTLLRKLFGCVYLDLKGSTFAAESYTSMTENLDRIVDLKFNIPPDTFLGHNYREIKDFLYRTKPSMYHHVVAQELRKVNSMIRYKHPYTQQSFRLTSEESQNFLYRMHYETPNNPRHQQLHRYITGQQKKYRFMFFS